MIDVTSRKLLKAFEDFRSRNEEYTYYLSFRSYDKLYYEILFSIKKKLLVHAYKIKLH